LTVDPTADLTLLVTHARPHALGAEERQHIAAWFKEVSASLPEPVRAYLSLQLKYLEADGDAAKQFASMVQLLRREMGITPSSERRHSGAPLAGLPSKDAGAPASQEERLEQGLARSHQLGDWHEGLKKRHENTAERLEAKLARMKDERMVPDPKAELEELGRVEDVELTEEEKAEGKAAGERFSVHLLEGRGTEPLLSPPIETLMPGAAADVEEQHVPLAAIVPPELSAAKVITTMHEERTRYDFSVSVTRIVLDVEKKVLEDVDGERHVISASTSEYGPPRFSVTWSALATLAVLVAQFALPFHRLGRMLSTAGKKFSTDKLSRMLHYVAERLLPIYLELARELAQCEVLGGDDTSSRVLEVSSYFSKLDEQATAQGPPPAEKPKLPWLEYRTPKAAEESLRRCEALTQERLRRRAAGDRNAKPTEEETPSLGVLIGRELTFESARKNGDGPKRSLNTTVITGQTVPDDPRSFIALYRTHLASCGDLFEMLLRRRSDQAVHVTLQGDLSSSNLVTAPDLLQKFKIKVIGCTAHCRRPFALYEDEDPVTCSYMLHLFLGLAMHEQQLDEFGRNRKNVLAVRGSESRTLWQDILKLATRMTQRWS
jgi:hypothetical protein